MQIPPLWIAVLVACVLAVRCCVAVARRPREAAAAAQPLSFDDASGGRDARTRRQFRLGRLSLSDGAGRRQALIRALTGGHTCQSS